MVEETYWSGWVFISKYELYDVSLQELHHPNIVNLVDFYEDSSAAYIVMEMLHGGELFQHIQRASAHITERDVAQVIKCVASSLQVRF